MYMKMWRSTALLLVGLVAMTSAATQIYNITINVNGMNMTNASSVQVDAGTTVVVTCQTIFNGTHPPTITFKKTFNTTITEIASNDQLSVTVLGDSNVNNRYTAVSVDNTPPGTDIYQYTIINAVTGDSGNYSCSTGTSPSIVVASSKVSLNVTVEPTSVTLYIDNETVPVSQSSTSYKKTMIVGQTYTLRCVAAGGNPFPNVALSTGSTLIPLTTTNYMTYKTQDSVDSFPGPLSRSTEIVARWQLTQQSLGVPVVCTAAAKSVNATNTSVSFAPLADNVAPQFQCADYVTYDGKASTLALSCDVYGNVNSSFVQWKNATGTVRINGTSSGSQDSRFSLRVTTQPGSGNLHYTMTLTITSPSSVGALYTTTYQFVASNSFGQAVHDVTVKSTGDTPSGGGSGGVGAGSRPAVPALGFLMVLLLSVVVLIRP